MRVGDEGESGIGIELPHLLPMERDEIFLR
jgi:hypothetical protein